ncbi:MAG: LysR family transcriptional regulator [Slackia sp.]|nr:LysR family transcriptional regulator [Slackia sp.]
MDIRHLEEFLALSRNLNYTVAAQEAHVARPTLSEHIAELEAELGCLLFAKHDGRLALTPIGKKFVRTAESLVEQVSEIVSEYRSLQGNFLPVRIAATNLPWLESLIHRAKGILASGNPRKIVEVISTAGAASTVGALFDGSNDIVVSGCKSWDAAEAPPMPQGISGFRLQAEPIMLLVTEGNPLFSKSEPCARDLDGSTILLPPDIYDGYMRDGVVDRFREYGADVSLRSLTFGDHFEYFSHGFDKECGVVPTTLVPRFGIDRRRECRAFELVDLKLSTVFYVMYRDEFTEDETARLFVGALRKGASEGV